MSESAVDHPAFDPALPGTPEKAWAQMVSRAQEWVPPDGPLLVVSPHPDDEVFGAGGLIRSWHVMGRDVTVVSVTDGEAAYPDWHGLDRVRQRELDDALRALCDAPIATVRLGIPDGSVAEHGGGLFAALSRLTKNNPTIIAPYESDGHPDHDTTGNVCRDVARHQGLTIARYPIWTWHHGDPHRFAAAHWRKVSLDAETQRAKAAAIQCYASQLRPVNRAPIVPQHVLPYFARPFEMFLV